MTQYEPVIGLEIHAELISATVSVTAFSARQKVTSFVVDQISTNMHATNPTLIMGERIFWRVPIVLSLPPTGDIGEVGTIDVDVITRAKVIRYYPRVGRLKNNCLGA